MTKRLDGTVALVTGASSGIGEATARALIAEGATVAVAARRKDRLDSYAGLTLGRGLAAILGGGFAPLICSALLAYFSGLWWPVARHT